MHPIYQRTNQGRPAALDSQRPDTTPIEPDIIKSGVLTTGNAPT